VKDVDTKSLKVIGMVSEVSASGISAVLAEIHGTGSNTRVEPRLYQNYPLRSKMLDAISVALRPEESRADFIAALNFALGELFAAAAIDLAKEAGVGIEFVDLIGIQGQTIWHSTEQTEVGGMWTFSTFQIGEPTVVSERTGVTVVADFRAADVAASCRGAPLSPYGDFLLFRSANRSRAVQNIGGISSVTYIPSGGKLDQIVAFDTGPGSMLMDAVVFLLTEGKKRSDIDGKLAMAGTVNRVMLSHLMEHPFVQKRPPKAVGHMEFGVQLAEQIISQWCDVSPEDIVATVTAFVAHSVRRSYERWLPKMPDDVIVSGVGARNPALMQKLSEALPHTKIYRSDDFGIDAEAKEALVIALLASEAIHGQPTSLPTATGAQQPVILGKIIPGRNYKELKGI
jgi:anhydro-N-acetylmuramic acid kinase